MQSAEYGLGNDATVLFDWSTDPRILAQRQVRPSLVIVAGIKRHDPVKVGFAEHDHVVRAFAPYRTDQTLHVVVVPR
jgi:hypothetical protein